MLTARSGHGRSGTSATRSARPGADTIILESQFSFAPDTTFAEAAAVTITTAQKIGGTKAAKAVTTAFANRDHLCVGRRGDDPSSGAGLTTASQGVTTASRPVIL